MNSSFTEFKPATHSHPVLGGAEGTRRKGVQLNSLSLSERQFLYSHQRDRWTTYPLDPYHRVHYFPLRCCFPSPILSNCITNSWNTNMAQLNIFPIMPKLKERKKQTKKPFFWFFQKSEKFSDFFFSSISFAHFPLLLSSKWNWKRKCWNNRELFAQYFWLKRKQWALEIFCPVLHNLRKSKQFLWQHKCN